MPHKTDADTMMMTIMLFRALLAFITVVAVHGHHSFRAAPVRSFPLPDWPFTFLVSHASENEDWCITANQGVTDGAGLGLNVCDFDNAPDRQLFLLDADGKMHSKVDPTQCLVVEQGTEAVSDGARIKFLRCDAQVSFNTFVHNRTTDKIRVAQDSTYCLKQTGNAPQDTDTIRAYPCDENDSGFSFDYRHYACKRNGFEDVECCHSDDCPDTGICYNYSCCSTDLPGFDCCVDADCSEDETCNGHVCVDVPRTSDCDTDNIGIDCCNNDDCLEDYDCISNACVSEPFFLISTSEDDDEDWCVSATNGVDDFVQVGLERCMFRNTPARQLWRRDAENKYHSNANLSRCMLVGPKISRFSGLQILMASCQLNMFVHDSDTGQVQLATDPNYCLTSQEEALESKARGKLCKNDDRFQFTVRDA
jgi:hypothetical protein